MKNVRVALVHDYLKEYGGAERVLEVLHEIWPEAPIFTAFVDWGGMGPHAKRLQQWNIRTSWVDRVWPVKKLHSPFRFLAPLVWESFNFDGYDIVITSSAWYIPRGIVTRPETTHICYLHAPPRHLYGYETGTDWQRYWPIRIYGHLVNHFLRMYDYLAAQRVDWFIANSQETKERIKKFYRREAKVIYPPVEVPEDSSGTNFSSVSNSLPRQKLEYLGGGRSDSSGYYLCVSRLARAKHIDLAIKACNKLKKPLVIVGKGREEKHLRSIAGSTIRFMGEVEDRELSDIYSGAKGLIFPAVDEEFGIVPVEAMAHGVPVIAYRSGGVVETVIEGKTGFFFDELSLDSLIKTLKHKNIKAIKSSDCIKQAQKFSHQRFKREMIRFIEKVVKNRGEFS